MTHTLAHSSPSVFSLKKAMQTYARQGGTSSIFVHDDGLQLISEEDREKRIAFYADHNIGWVARPGHSKEPDGFKRAGRFKKASNMNYGIQVGIFRLTYIYIYLSFFADAFDFLDLPEDGETHPGDGSFRRSFR